MDRHKLSREFPAHVTADNEVGLLHAAVIEIAYAESTAAALQALLRRVCEKTGWTLGQAWVPEQGGPTLERHAVWVADARRNVNKFVSASESLRFLPGEGLPGRVWLSKQPTWILDVAQDKNFPRSSRARSAGIRTALAVPILADLEAIAVLEFFLRERRDEDERLTILIATVAAQ